MITKPRGPKMSKQTSLPYKVLAFLPLLALVFVGVAPATAETPARPVPQVYWPEDPPPLKPVAENQVPSLRDSTWFQDNDDGNPKNPIDRSFDIVPFWQAITAEGGFLFTGLSHGMQVWDPSSNPAVPSLVAQLDWRVWPRYCGQFEIQHVLQDLDVPRGDGTVAAMVGVCDVGLAVVDTTNKAKPRLAYQDDEFESSDVYAVRIGTTSYAYAATSAGLRVYNMNQAKQYNGCLDSAEGCPGVHVATLRAGERFRDVNGVDQFLAVALEGNGVEVWNIASPSSPKVKLKAAFTRTVQTTSGPKIVKVPVTAVEMWRVGGDYYLGFVKEPGSGIPPSLQIFNVDCIQSAGSCTLGAPLQTIQGRNGALSASLELESGGPILTASRSNGIDFLYVGNTNRTRGAEPSPQREWLLNVSTPDVFIEDITPPTRRFVNGVEIGYWGWYYISNPTGFRNMAPRQGVFVGDHFYRAGFSIFDVHQRLGNSPPVADFDFASLESDGRIYPGSTVRFTDASSGVPDSVVWDFPDGTPSSSSADQVDVAFDSAGTKTVSLTAHKDGFSPDVFSDAVTVLPPEPALSGVTANLQTATLCQTITLNAVDPVGKPTLKFDWEILDSSSNPLTPTQPISPQQTTAWEVPPGLDTGNYTAKVTVTNDSGSATAQSAPITIEPLPALPQAGFLIDDPVVTNGVVEFHVDAPGATEWRWDFGDGTTPEWTSDPVNGPSPVHTYAEVGTYEVTVEVRNCLGGPVLSAVVEVVVESVVDLHAEFQATNIPCGGVLGCSADLGETIEFTDQSTGAQLWEYDWDGDGVFEESSTNGPITTHAYQTPDDYHPVLRVSRRNGEEVDTDEHKVISVGNPPAPPTIRVTGPRAGETGVQHAFSASCSGAGSTGWSWSASGGGAFSGSRTGSTVRISWNSTGSKTVSASHSGCTSGSARITISNPSDPDPDPDPGGDLKAAFNFTPAQPQAGQSVSFNASGSSGSPEGYIWDFGDGTSTSTGVTATHTYAAPGTYLVLLTVSKRGSGAGCQSGICFDELTKTVVVGGGGPGPDPEPEPEPGAVCPDDPNAFCLLDGRFKIEVDWRNQHDGGTEGVGKPVNPTPLANQDTTGFYYFFNPFSTDLIVKVIDGTTVNGNFWFFYGALTDVEYTITVTDQETGVAQEYHNEPNNVCGQGDVRAFPVTAPPADGVSAWRVGSFDAVHQADGPGGGDDPEPEPEPDPDPEEPETSGACEPGPKTLCLLDGRFEVGVHFKDQINDKEGDGVAIPGTDQTGYFWFFQPSNVELVVKAIDATGFNDRFWFFYGALSTVEYDIVVTDTETGAEKIYHNDPDNICGQADTRAFEP